MTRKERNEGRSKDDGTEKKERGLGQDREGKGETVMVSVSGKH